MKNSGKDDLKNVLSCRDLVLPETSHLLKIKKVRIPQYLHLKHVDGEQERQGSINKLLPVMGLSKYVIKNFAVREMQWWFWPQQPFLMLHYELNIALRTFRGWWCTCAHWNPDSDLNLSSLLLGLECGPTASLTVDRVSVSKELSQSSVKWEISQMNMYMVMVSETLTLRAYCKDYFAVSVKWAKKWDLFGRLSIQSVISVC